MPHGQPDKWLVDLRRGLDGAREPQPPVPDHWWANTTPNHALARMGGGYALDPKGPWRAELLTTLRQMNTTWGPWCIRQSDETLSGSHCAHYYAPLDAVLLIALQNGDSEMVAAVLAVSRAVHAVETACAATNGVRIVAPGAREPGVNGEKANQRMNRNQRWGWVEGRKVHMPKTLATADDELGFFCLTKIGQPNVAQLLRGANPADVVMRNPLTVTCAKDGRHLAVFTSTDGMTSPSTWALSDPETYGLPGQPAPALEGVVTRVGRRPASS